MRYETIIIGGGLSALVSGIALAKEGKRVAIISSGQSALHFSSGSMELCSLGENPIEAISKLDADHPYSVLGIERVAESLKQGRAILEQAGVKLRGSMDRNHYRLTPIGQFKPAWLTIDDYVSVPSLDEMPWRKVLLVNFDGYLDFFPKFIASGLAKFGVESRIESISLPELDNLRQSTTEMRASNIARMMSGEVLEKLAERVNTLLSDEDVVMMPAVVGLYDTKPVEQLRSLVERDLFFVPTIPASVLGVRTQMQLRSYFKSLGGDYFLGDNVVSGRVEGSKLLSVQTSNHEDVVLSADNFIMATGSFFSHGLIADSDRVYEPVLGLDLRSAGQRSEWYDKDLYSEQPYMKFGVEYNSQLQASIKGCVIENLYVAGAILAGQSAIEQGTGAGVAISSAIVVANNVLNR